MDWPGFQSYIDMRAERLTGRERKLLLACTVLMHGLPLLSSAVSNSAERLYIVRTGLGEFAVVGASGTGVLPVRGASMNMIRAAFHLSRCARAYSTPAGLYVRLLDERVALAHIVAVHAWDLVLPRELQLASESPTLTGRLARLYMRMRRLGPAEGDPGSVALERCWSRLQGRYGRYIVVGDLRSWLEMEAGETVFFDGESVGPFDPVITPNRPCPVRSLTLVSLEESTMVHMSDAGAR